MGHNHDLRVTDETVTKGGTSSKVTLGYDPDGLVTCASLGTCTANACTAGQSDCLALGRDGPSGRLTSLALGTVTETYAYNTSYGELKSQDSTPFRIDYEGTTASPVVRDALGRVKRRIERIGVGAASKTFNYTYDEQNRLWKVDGAVTSEYRYDSNGNRTYAKNSFGIVDATVGGIIYDDQDRLIRYDATIYQYTVNGDLLRKVGPEGETAYAYDALGNLRSVRLPDGRVIDYLVDGFGHRIAKKVNGILQKQWVHGKGLAPLAELDANGAVTMRFIYGSKPNVPDLIKAFPSGTLYRVFSDQLVT